MHPDKDKKQTGRPTKLTKQLIKEIASLVAGGNYIETACAFCGISKDTYYRWAKEGARAQTGLKKEFSDVIKKAQATAEIRDVMNIGKASEIAWQASAWRLERKYPDRWGVRQKVELGGSVDINNVRKLAEEIIEARKNGKDD